MLVAEPQPVTTSGGDTVDIDDPAILAAQGAWGRGVVRRVLGVFSLRSWMWPLAALVLVPVATRIPRPADLSVPAMSELFTPMVLVTPEGGSYRFVAFDGWEKFKPVYSVSWGVTSAQEVTRTGRELPLGANLGFFHRSATWRYSLFESRFDWKSPADGVLDIAPGEIAKLRPLVVEELNKRAFGRGRALEDFLDNGRHEETSVCWQNCIVALAWLSRGSHCRSRG